MEHKLLFGMLGGFIAFTVMAVVVVYALTADLSFASFQPSKKTISESKSDIALDPKPQPVIKEQPTKTPAPPAVAGATIENTSNEKTISIDVSNLYSLINAHRKEQGLSSLRIHQALELSSRRKLEDMRANNYWRHENAQGVMDWSIFDNSGYHYSSAGENLSFANNSAWAVFDSWVNSPVHNEQMLKSEYEDMGLAVDCENYTEAGKKKCAVVLHLGRQL